jgi:hypothetical protein
VTKQKPAVHVDVAALARDLVPLLVPALVEALTKDWDAAPDHRIVWDEQGNVVGLHEQVPSVRYWDVVGWNEQGTKAWVQLMPYVKWEPEHSLFDLLESEGKQPQPAADPERFRRWQEWQLRNPASEHGPVYLWRKPRKRRQPK